MSRPKKGRRKKGRKKQDHQAAQGTIFSVFGWKIDRPVIFALAFLTAILALTLAVYLPGLSDFLVLDDLSQLNGLIAQSTNEPAELLRKYITSNSGPFGRPVSMLTFIGSAITHGPDIWWWKFDNVMLHLISGLLVFWLTALLVQATQKGTDFNPWIIGAVAAGFWLLHPLHVSTVLYTVQRMTELSALFVLAGLISYTKGRLLQAEKAGQGWLFIGLGFGLFYPLAVLSKESALLFPVFCSLLEICIFQFRGDERLQRQIRFFHSALVAVYVILAAYVLANFSSLVLDGYAIRDFTFIERVLTQFRVVVLYLSQILLPIQSKMGFFHDDISLSTGLLNPVSTLWSVLLLGALIGSAYLLRKKAPLYAFGILFFFASHLLESSVFALEIMFEHRNYLGSVGIVIAVLSLIPMVIRNRAVLVLAAVIGLSWFSYLTWQLSPTWRTPITFFRFAYDIHPESKRLNLTFANAHAKAGEFESARQSLAKVAPGLGQKITSILIDCLQYRKVDDVAIRRITQGNKGILNNYTTSTTRSLVREVVVGRCNVSHDALVALLDHVLAARAQIINDKYNVMFAKANYLESINQVDAAVRTLVEAQQWSVEHALPLTMAARMLLDNDRPDEARAMLARAYNLNKNTKMRREDIVTSIYLDLARNYAGQDKFQEALAVYATAISSIPGQIVFYLESADLLLKMRQYQDLERLLAEIRALNLKGVDQYDHLLKRFERAVEQQ